jgi:hypothetical protein
MPAVSAPPLLFGLDRRGRPHAACFVGHEPVGAVEQAADLMDLYCVAAEADALRDLSAKLPEGRLFPASGKAFVPFTSVALYSRLLALTGMPDAPRPAKAAAKSAEAGAGVRGKSAAVRTDRALATRLRRGLGRRLRPTIRRSVLAASCSLRAMRRRTKATTRPRSSLRRPMIISC